MMRSNSRVSAQRIINKVIEFSSYGIAQDAAALLARIWQENAPAGAKSRK
jgi:hypothetical protein